MKLTSPKSIVKRLYANEGKIDKNTSATISGWLLKRKRSKTVIGFKWNKRWFSIESGCLVWYLGKRRSSKTSFPSGSIPLDDIQQVYKLNTVTEKEEHVVIIKARKQSLCLASKRDGDCDKWVRMIQMQLDLMSGGTVSGPKSSKNRRLSNGGGDNLDQKVRSIERQLSDLSTACLNRKESLLSEGKEYLSMKDITMNARCRTQKEHAGPFNRESDLPPITKYHPERMQKYRRQKSVSSLNSMGSECKSETRSDEQPTYLAYESKNMESWQEDYLKNVDSESSSASFDDEDSLSVTSIQQLTDDDDGMLFSRSTTHLQSMN